MGRGPSYPYVGLEEAISLTKKFFDYAKRAPAPTDAVIKDAWKLSTSSSGSQKSLAALRAFGLVEDAPGSNGKSIKVSQRGIRILLDEDDSKERKDEIKKAALSPKWYEYCWKTWGKEMPASMRSNLLIEHGFVDTTVEGFLKDYRKTIAFAGLLDDTSFGKKEDSLQESKYSFKIGDYVQWEVKGELKMPEAKKIAAFYDDGKYATVEGSSNPVAVAELIPAETPEGSTPPPSVFNLPVFVKPVGHGEVKKMENESFALSDGVTCQIQWPSCMTKESFEDFEYRLEGLRRRVKRAVGHGEINPDVSSQG